MVRFITILIGVLNFLMIRSWVATNAYLFNLIEQFIPYKFISYIGLGIVFGLILFFLIHSLRLILFNESARKIQQIICIIDPFIKLVGVILIINFETKFKPSFGTAAIMVTIFTIIDIIVYFYLQKQKTIEVFKAAEDRRDQKFRMKLMKK